MRTLILPWWFHFVVYANAFIASGIAVRLIFFKRHDARHRPLVSWLAWILILATMAIPFIVVSGRYIYLFPAEMIINAVLCAAIWAQQGNLAELFRPNWKPWDGRERRQSDNDNVMGC